jgi:hypothetical protein
MLDAILYAIDDRGRIVLHERRFGSLDDVALFFASDEAGPWDWVELHECRPGGGPPCRRYSAEQMRALADGPGPAIARN